MADAFGAFARVNLVDFLAEVNRLVGAFGLAHITVDAFIGDKQRHDQPPFPARAAARASATAGLTIWPTSPPSLLISLLLLLLFKQPVSTLVPTPRPQWLWPCCGAPMLIVRRRTLPPSVLEPFLPLKPHHAQGTTAYRAQSTTRAIASRHTAAVRWLDSDKSSKNRLFRPPRIDLLRARSLQ